MQIVTETFVRLRIDDHKRNALNTEVLEQIAAAVDEAVGLRRPLVIEGRPGTFCAGFDLAVVRGDDQTKLIDLLQCAEGVFRRIVDAPIPVIAACTGHALAAGALLLLACDLRIGASGDYKIGCNEVPIGLALPEFAVHLATARIGPRHLTAATACGEIYDPQRAVEVGFLDEVSNDVLATSAATATRMAALSPSAFANTKAFLRREVSARLRASTLVGPAEYPW